MADETREARDSHREAGAEPALRKSNAPKLAMLFSATGWTFNVRLGRSGREEGEGIILMGEVSYRTSGGERRVHPSRAMVVKSDARKRLDLVLGAQEAVLTISLEPFAMQRLQDRLKDLVSGYGMAVQDRIYRRGLARAAGSRGSRLRVLVGAQKLHPAKRRRPRPTAKKERLSHDALDHFRGRRRRRGLRDLHLQPPRLDAADERGGWSGIDVQLKRRADLVPNLVETVKGYATTSAESSTRSPSFAHAAQNVPPGDVEGARQGGERALARARAVARGGGSLSGSEGEHELRRAAAGTRQP